ncbi:MAG TPA: TetR/AcrR family transcriptional regulator [Stellaceae bacterium]|nr:TetR/AcrR family transcriptional regulator [Stellaceae bacterium]
MPARKRPKQPSGDPKQRLIAAALTLAAAQGWRRIGMAEIASAAGVSLTEAYGLVRSKPGILAALRRQTDETMLAGGAVSGDSPRDRLFDALMRRFEALQPYRTGLRAVLRDSVGDPAMVGFLPGLLRSMSWTLTVAGLPASGCRGQLARRLVGALYVSLLPTFFRDEGRDLGSTMAALDRRLRQVESLLSALGPFLGADRARS